MKIIADLLVVLSPVPVALFSYTSGARFAGLSTLWTAVAVYLIGLVVAWASMMFVITANKQINKENKDE